MVGEKIGRNDPCVCGSGKKYKHCCLVGGESTAGTGARGIAEELLRALEGQEFERLDELQAELDRVAHLRNTAPLAEFHGLSPVQMNRVLYSPFESPEIATFADVLPVEPEAPVVGLFSALVEGLGEDGAKATAKGNLPRALCRQVAEVWLESQPPRVRAVQFAVNKEDDFYALHALRLVAGLAGLIRKYRGRFVLTRRYHEAMEKSGMAGIYPILFRTFVQKFNWAYGDGYPDLPFIQHSFLFSLYLLERHGGERRIDAFYTDAYLGAFPALLEEVESRPYSSAEQTAGHCHFLRTFERFAEFFGLARIERANSKDLFARECFVVKTPLLGQMLQFHL